MRLVEFLTKVVTDPDWRDRFCEDPDETIRRAELSAREVAALESGDPQKVAFAICAGGRWPDDKPVD